MSSRSTVAWAASARRRTSASAERSAARKSAAPPLASMSATTRAPLSASRPCTSTRAPACPSLRATSQPTPSVEPVTSAVFPLNCSIPGLFTSLDERDYFGMPGAQSRRSRRLKRSQPVQPGAKKRRGQARRTAGLFEGGTRSWNPFPSPVRPRRPQRSRQFNTLSPAARRQRAICPARAVPWCRHPLCRPQASRRSPTCLQWTSIRWTITQPKIALHTGEWKLAGFRSRR